MKASVFGSVSVDGFIARKNHDLDFLPEAGNEDYAAFIATIDAIVIGRNTFEKVLLFGGAARSRLCAPLRRRRNHRATLSSRGTGFASGMSAPRHMKTDWYRASTRCREPCRD